MKKVFCLRGLPGSGKNTWIESNQKTYWRHKKVVVCSADDYHMINGEYKFDPSMIGEAHNSCMQKFLAAVGSVDAKHSIEIVVVNNTNISAWEIAPYAAVARATGYEFEIVQIQCNVQKSISRNTHGVAPETIGAMAESMRREILPGQWPIKKITDDITTNDDIAKFLDAIEKRGVNTYLVDGVEENVASKMIVSLDRENQTLYLIPSYVPTYKGIPYFTLDRSRIPEMIRLIETASSVCTPHDIEEAVCIIAESHELPCECGVKGEWDSLHYPSIHEG